MRKYIAAVMLLSMAVLTIPASAGTYSCQGNVTNLNVYYGGWVTVSLSGSGGTPGITVCSLTAAFGNWTPESCKAAYSMLLSAKLSGLQVAIAFNDALSCSTQPAGAAVSNNNYAVYIPN